ncbi:MAG TPA: hypothetical protein VJM06_00550 [Gaiellaceae bacterium]|nr:hypothetical protein [Gaiellaceae bacterium]
MTRILTLSVALCCALVLGVHAGAQSEMPTQLWSEYPLVQKVESTGTSKTVGIGPFLPPADPDADPAPEDSTRWSIWLALLALGAVAILYAARTASPVVASGARALGGRSRRLRAGAPARPRSRGRRPRPIQLRAPVPRPRAPVSRRQYAPLPPMSVPESDNEREPRRFVMRRTGVLRSRFVVVDDEPGGGVRRVARSKAFWSVGRHERGGAEVWGDLVDELRDAGWEPYSPRSEYYTLLRRIDAGTSALPPTIEAYSRAADDPDER